MPNNKIYRFFEIIPGLLAWLTIILMILLSWLTPVIIAIFIIVFDIYWFFRTIHLLFHLHATFKKMRKNLKIDWLSKLADLQKYPANNASVRGIIRHQNHICDCSQIYHLIILTLYKEPYEVVKESFENLINVNYPKEKFIVVLATEERAGKQTREIAEKIKKEFGDKFFKFLITTHIVNPLNEMPGKGSNETWAAKEVKKLIIDPLIMEANNRKIQRKQTQNFVSIKYENILVSVFDIDTQVPLNYFSRLTYAFLSCENPQRSSFQPIPFFTNNIFQAPALGRVISFSATFWQMMQQSRQEQLATFSSHSMPFKALVEIGFWDTSMVSEDSRIFWQCYLHYNGDWRVIPLFYPVSMDANVAPKFWQTMVNIYKQQRRWGWGCENIPYILNGFMKNKKIPFGKKMYWGFIVIENFHSWATNALIIFALGWLPLILGGANFNFTLLSYNLPQITHLIMTVTMFGVIITAILAIILLPPKPDWFKKRHYFLYFIQWALIPIILIIFGAFPGLEAQTRLMLGGKFRLNYWTTPKHR